MLLVTMKSDLRNILIILHNYYFVQVSKSDHAAYSGSNEIWDTCSWGVLGQVVHRWDNDNGNSWGRGGWWPNICSTGLEHLDLSYWILREW